MPVIVTKFGGSSLADAGQFKKVKDIVLADENRMAVVPSAPGKRFSGDNKITDLLYSFWGAVNSGKEWESIFQSICERFIGIRDELELTVEIEQYLEKIKEDVLGGESEDYTASRGEYLNGILLADYLGFAFLDAASAVCFDKKGKYDSKKTSRILKAETAKLGKLVLPGFYGAMPDGRIKTFSRGGSDITGAILAGSLKADVYENWTDVSGFLMADPRIVKNPKKIESITYRELRELSYMGATVLHEDSIFPVYQAGIPINVRNTNRPEDSGTMIVPSLEPNPDNFGVTGIAGKKNFTVISIEKDGMNSELGFGRKVLSCIEKYGIPFEHMPSSIDTLCVVLEDSKLKDNLNDVVDDIYRICSPDSIEVFAHMALVATVGRGMVSRIGFSAKLFGALADAKVNVRMIDQGSSEMNIIVGVENDDFEKSVNAIYNALIGQ